MKFWWPFFGLKNPFFWPKLIFLFLNVFLKNTNFFSASLRRTQKIPPVIEVASPHKLHKLLSLLTLFRGKGGMDWSEFPDLTTRPLAVLKKHFFGTPQ